MLTYNNQRFPPVVACVGGVRKIGLPILVRFHSSSVYHFALEIYKTRGSKYLKANGEEAQGKLPGL